MNVNFTVDDGDFSTVVRELSTILVITLLFVLAAGVSARGSPDVSLATKSRAFA